MIFNYEEIPHDFNWQYNGSTGYANIKGLNIEVIKKIIDIPFPPLIEFIIKIH